MLVPIGRAGAARSLCCNYSSLKSFSTAPTRFIVYRSPLSIRRRFTVSSFVRDPSAKAPKLPKTTRATGTPPKATAKTKTKTPKVVKPKAKPKPKKIAAPKKVKKPKKELDPEQSLALNLRKLRGIALLKSPKLEPTNSWSLFLSQNLGAGNTVPFAEKVKAVKAQYESLSESEKATYVASSVANREKNREIHDSWVITHPAGVVWLANKARSRINTHKTNTAIRLIHDPRLLAVKRSTNPVSYFIKANWSDYHINGTPVTETLPKITRVWNDVPQSEKAPYEALAKAESEKSTAQIAELKAEGYAYWQDKGVDPGVLFRHRA